MILKFQVQTNSTLNSDLALWRVHLRQNYFTDSIPLLVEIIEYHSTFWKNKNETTHHL